MPGERDSLLQGSMWTYILQELRTRGACLFSEWDYKYYKYKMVQRLENSQKDIDSLLRPPDLERSDEHMNISKRRASVEGD